MKMQINDEGEFIDTARVEMGLIGPSWLPILRMRFYLDSKPEDHVTIWKVRWLHKIFGSYTPPAWFLKMIGQIK